MKIVAASQQKRQRKIRNVCQDLLTTENTDSDLKVHALHDANELLIRFRLAFQTLLQTETIRNYQKQVLVMIELSLTEYQSKGVSYKTFPFRIKT